MRPSLRLSSSLTFLGEWVFPALWLLSLPLWIQDALRIPFPLAKWVIVILWSVGLILVLIYSWPIKLVTLERDCFVISNYFTSRRVPITHLAKVSESYAGRVPTIILHFDPPTPLGKRVRIITATGLFLFNNRDFDEIVALLRSLNQNT